jgi:hypothetical protein
MVNIKKTETVNGRTDTKWPNEKGQKDKTLHRTPKIEQSEPH